MLDEKFWAKYFRVYDVLNLLIPYQELLDSVCEELDIKKNEKILEAGCGTGNLAIKIRKRGAEVIGLDNCKEALEIYKEKDPEAKVVLADLTEKLPFPDNYFDKIASNNVLYAIQPERQLKIMKEFYRVLKEGGKVVLVNPKINCKPVKIYIRGIKENFKKEGFFNSVSKIVIMIFPTIKILYYNYLIKKEKDYSFLSSSERKELLDKAGFKNIKMRNVYHNQNRMAIVQKG